jgi:hypothetical protein
MAMQCPIDGENLVMSERSGVEIDYCPKCRGVWLDRGELDKILERAVGEAPRTASAAPRRSDDDDRRYGDDDPRYGKRKKREGFLGELFDF